MDFYAPPLCTFLKYADDFCIGRNISDSVDTLQLQHALTSIKLQAESECLYLNPDKCLEMLFSLRHGASLTMLNDSTPHLQINGVNLKRIGTMKYLGVHITQNLSWSVHVSSIFTTVRKLCFYIRRLRSAGTPPSHIANFTTMCVLPHITYCSPVIFAGLLKKDYRILRRAIKLISRCGMLPYDSVVDSIMKIHVKSCEKFSTKIIEDPSHPLHDDFTSHMSRRVTRRPFRHMYTKTSAFRGSILPYLCRFRTNTSFVMEELVLNLK